MKWIPHSGLRGGSFSLQKLNVFGNQAVEALGKRRIDTVNNSTSSSVKEPRHWSEIPGPKVYPVIKNMFSLLVRKDFNPSKINVVFENMFKEFGPIYCLQPVITPNMVILTNPDDIETLFRATADNPVRFAFLALREVRLQDPMFEKKGGIITENYEEWKRVRSKVSTPMLRPKTIVKYLSKMDDVTLQFMERIAELAKENEKGEMPSDFQSELYKWALESVGVVALDRRLGCLNKNLPPNSSQETLIKVVNNIFFTMSELEGSLHQMWKFFPSKKFKQLVEGHKLLCSIADDAIKETEKSLQEKSSQGDEAELTLMETLLNTEGLDRRDVITMITDMLFAGIDTTSHAVGFTLYFLAKNPQVQQKLFEEVNRVLGRSAEHITEKQLASLSYLKCCVKESMRLFPVVLGASRVLEKDVVFSGYKVPKGCIGLAMNYLTCRDEKYFKRANEYLPERWGRDQPLGAIHPFAFLPFSHGLRMCIGRRIAEQEIYVFIARVIQRFSVDYKYEDMGFNTRIVAVPSHPLLFEFKERN